MGQVYFKEVQRLRELAFFALVWVLQLLFIFLLVKQVLFHKPVGTVHSDDSVLIIINLLILFIQLLLFSKQVPYHSEHLSKKALEL